MAIPIGAVAAVNQDGIRLNIPRQEVKDLRPAGIDHAGEVPGAAPAPPMGLAPLVRTAGNLSA